MKILVADDDAVCRHVLELVLRNFGHDLVSCGDGDEAWRVLQQPDAPPLAILDWIMPDDYIPKPFDYEELRVRVQVGERIVKLQQALAQRVAELQRAVTRVSQVQPIIPICKFCKKVHADENHWDEVENFLARHSQSKFCEGVCPDCLEVGLQLEKDAV
ncbi:MAG: response regulator transcription factor [Verrucomicrobia bacterium]|nr:response regulator transcription factor [Verrucomicrobiota bacterium]